MRHSHQIEKQTKEKTTSFKMGFTARVFIRSGDASQSQILPTAPSLLLQYELLIASEYQVYDYQL